MKESEVSDFIAKEIEKFTDYRTEKCPHCDNIKVVNNNGYPKVIIVPKRVFIKLLNDSKSLVSCRYCDTEIEFNGIRIIPEYKALVIEEDIC